MDEFKRLFYMHRPDLLNSDIGSVTNRLKFKQVISRSFIPGTRDLWRTVIASYCIL